MLNNQWVFQSLYLLFAVIIISSSAMAATPVLDVGIVLNKPSIEIACSTGLLVRSQKGGRLLIRMSKNRKLNFSRTGKVIRTIGNKVGKEFFVEPAGRGFLSVSGKEYRGHFIVKASVKSQSLNLVNQIDIEEYLKGVLKAEMLASFKPEALKAQAIVSRTFALRHKDQFRARGYGIKASEQSQMYKGVSGEDVRTTVAVMATRGIVLINNNELIESSYHSCCGGRTESNEAVWKGTPKPYSRSVRCTWCKDAPHYEWKADLTYDEIEKALEGHGWELGSIAKLELDYSESGRVRYVVITTGKGREVYIPGNKFRIIVDRRKLKSLKFVFKDDPVGDLLAMNPDLVPSSSSLNSTGELPGSLNSSTFSTEAAQFSNEKDMAIQAIISGYLNNYTASKKKLIVTGRGFGHGVGLCQWGAQGLAKKGFSFRKILGYYYKETKLRKIF